MGDSQGQPGWGQQDSSRGRPPWQPPQSGPPSAGAGWGAPPPTPPFSSPPPPSPPPKRRLGKTIGLGCAGALGLAVVIGVVAAIAGSGGDSPKDNPVTAQPASKDSKSPTGAARDTPAGQKPGPEGDVKITSCTVDPTTSWASAEVLITNRSSKTSTYWINIEFVDRSGKRLDESFTSTSDLAPGQKAQETAQGLTQISTRIMCRVTDVTRFAS